MLTNKYTQGWATCSRQLASTVADIRKSLQELLHSLPRWRDETGAVARACTVQLLIAPASVLNKIQAAARYFHRILTLVRCIVSCKDLLYIGDLWSHTVWVQDRDPKAYQLYLQLPDGSTFFGSTPERLYVRTGSHIASEAVAATRPRGSPGDGWTCINAALASMSTRLLCIFPCQAAYSKLGDSAVAWSIRVKAGIHKPTAADCLLRAGFAHRAVRRLMIQSYALLQRHEAQ